MSAPSLSVALDKTLGTFRLRTEFETGARAVALFGPSGSGKTTTLRCICGLVTPDRGRIVVRDRVLFDSELGPNLPPQQRRVGYVPQHYAVFPHLTALENVAYGLIAPDRREQEARARALLETVGLADQASLRPAQLSGGQQQRVALARALAIEPPLLLLDEPFASLDRETRLETQAQLQRLQADLDLTIVLVTHDPEDVAALSGDVVVFDRGSGVLQAKVG